MRGKRRCCIVVFLRWLCSLGSSFLGAFYDAVARDIERRAIFPVRDRRRYLELLAERVERFEVRLFAYCLMGSDVHLGVETGRALGRERWTMVPEVRYLEERLASDFRLRRTVHRIQTRLGR